MVLLFPKSNNKTNIGFVEPTILIMKFDRRTFLKLVPAVGAAAAAGSWYFLRQPLKRQGPEGQISTSVTTKESTLTRSTSTELKESATASSETAAAEKGFNFPATWNGDKATEVNLAEYRLTVDGDVSNPLELTVDDLHGMPSVKKTLNIACVLGWEADVPWEGIPLSHILNLARAPKSLDYITFKAVTGYGARILSNDLSNPDNMIAMKAGDAPLTTTHGYPARLVVPTRPGVDWVKYVNRITCTKK